MSTKREEMLKKKAEDEARKAGTLPAEKDEHGRSINPHIPDFMKTTPWYVQKEGAMSSVGLDHQRLPENLKDHSDIGVGWYDRGKTSKKPQQQHQAFTPGSCTNCGAANHNAKNCLERPRKVGASVLNTKLREDDQVLPDLHLSYDGKRDKYNGFTPELQLDAIQTRNLLKHQQQVQSNSSSQKPPSLPALEIPKASLRIRSDTAKYLRNLDPESAFYDPKTRSMRANPNPELPLDEVSFAGDNFVRNTGEVEDFNQVESFAKDDAALLQSNPTLISLQRAAYLKSHQHEESLALKKRNEVELAYLGQDATPTPPIGVVPKASSVYAEYTLDGKRVPSKFDETFIPSSRFEEDVLEGNHTQIWGSYLDRTTKLWGYSCCWQTIRRCYCVGEKGKIAVREAQSALKVATTATTLMPSSTASAEVPVKKMSRKKPTEESSTGSSSSSSLSSDWNSSDSDREDTKKKKKKSKKKKKKSHKSKRHQKSTRSEKIEDTNDTVDSLRLSRIRQGDPMSYLVPKNPL